MTLGRTKYVYQIQYVLVFMAFTGRNINQFHINITSWKNAHNSIPNIKSNEVNIE